MHINASLPPAIQNRARQLEMPVLYREAIAALERCATMDEAKYYSEKSDALAAWAKIYGSDEDSRAAARLKLKAYARMGELATELRPQQRARRSDGRIMGKKNGPASLLREHGIDRGHEFVAMKLSRLPKPDFERLIEGEKVPTPMAAFRSSSFELPEMGTLLAAASTFRTACRKLSPAMFSPCITTSAQRSLFSELLEWLDELDRSLPK